MGSSIKLSEIMQRFGKLILGEQIDLNVKKVYCQKIWP